MVFGILLMLYIVFLWNTGMKNAWREGCRDVLSLLSVSAVWLDRIIGKWFGQREISQKSEDRRIRKEAIWLLLVGVLLLFSIVASGNQNSAQVLVHGSQLLRQKPGEGSREVVLDASIDGEMKSEQKFTVREKTYTEEELKKVQIALSKYLLKKILGGNSDFQHITQTLSLPTQYKGVKLTWDSTPAYIDETGEVAWNAIWETCQVSLTVHAVYQEESWYKTYELVIQPPKRSKKERLLHQLEEELQASNKESATKKSWQLPVEVEGKRIAYQEKLPESPIRYIWLMGVLAFAVTPFLLQAEERKRERRRMELLLADYPDFVSRFVLLCGAGLTPLSSLTRMIEQDQIKNRTPRPLYEELRYTWNEIQNGEAERVAYQHMGRRLKLAPYLRFTTLLTQNMRKGNERLLSLLQLEVIETQKERQQVAQKRGEETGSKLLVPIGIMFLLVLSIIIFAAFAQM